MSTITKNSHVAHANQADFSVGFAHENGALTCENVKINDIAKSHQTPFYVYNKASFQNQYNVIKKAFNGQNVSICYAVKANDRQDVIDTFAEMGSGFDCVSIGEVKKCLISCKQHGTNSLKIIVSGVGKTKSELKFYIENCVKINVESLEELNDIIEIAKNEKLKATFTIRINPNTSIDTHKNISTGSIWHKFGVEAAFLPIAFNSIKKSDSEYVDFVGLAVHGGSQITKGGDFENIFAAISEAVNLAIAAKMPIKTIDLGGGLGVKYTNESVDFDGYVKAVKNVIDKFKDVNPTIILSLGRFLSASAGILVTKIIRVKKTTATAFAIVDAGMNNFLRPALYGAKHTIVPVNVNLNSKYSNHIYDIVGPICETSDTFDRNITMQKLHEEDLLAICGCGAYGSVMGSSYNATLPTKEFFIYETNKYKEIH